MKKVYTIIALALTAIAIASCQNDNTIIEGFEADIATIEAEPHGGEYRLTIRSEREWTVTTDVPWIMISPANGRGEVQCRVKVDSTLTHDNRTTNIRFSSEGEILQNVEVKQEGYAEMITPSSDVVEVAASATRASRHFDLGVTTNTEFKVVAEYDSEEQWLHVGDYSLTLDRGARPRKTTLNINWDMNTEPRVRKAELKLCTESGAVLSTVNIHQQAAPLIEDNRAGDSLAIVTIYEKLNCWAENTISTSESMNHWECVRLWRATDSSLPEPEAVGRVRDLDLSYFNTEDDLPIEFKHLKYLETLSLFGNVNTMLKDIHICDELCELKHLKALRIAAFGVVSLPASFSKLGSTLETLDLNSNNFTEIPAIITRENFPHLRSLNLASNRRHMTTDLRGESGVGLVENTAKSERLKRLLLWEELEELVLSYNYMEGSLPDFTPGEDGVRAYTREDFAERGDSLNWAVESALPRILPNMRRLTLNLNFFTGTLPDWLLYHPRLMEWGAMTLIYPQQEKGVDSEGRSTGFENVPTSAEYYFERYPLLRGRFEFNDEIEE